MIQGMLTIEELSQRIAADEVRTVVVGMTDLYGRLVGKRFDANYFLEEVAEQGTHCCDYLYAANMEMDPVPGYKFANWEKGYGDVHLQPDFATLRLASWLDRSAFVLCDTSRGDDHAPVAIAPRQLLKQQIERAAAMGLEAYAASELEYFLYRTTYRQAAEKGYQGLEAAGWYLEDYHLLQGARIEDFTAAARQHLNLSGVPVECTKGEWGLGQHELNIRYCDILGMADRHVVYKQCLKELADRMGVSVTFMAKIAHDAAGSSNHIHISLRKLGSQENAFAGDKAIGAIRCSPIFEGFLAGWMEHLPELMPFYAPTINSYKRYQPGSWAPTKIAWCRDNRTAGFRVVGNGASLRIECRVPGADANPYLAYAASLASGLDGIERGLSAPAVFEGDVYEAQHLKHVPRTLAEAAELFGGSDWNAQTLGSDVVEHYLHFFNTEVDEFNRAVTDWERKRYFERI